MKKNKKQLHEALAVLLTKLSSARDNPLLMDNYVVKALRRFFLSSRNLANFRKHTRSKYNPRWIVTTPWYL